MSLPPAPQHHHKALPTSGACAHTAPLVGNEADERETKVPTAAAAHNGTWDEMLERLRAYKEANGDTRVPSSYAPDPKLAQWVRNQRIFYRQKQRGNYSFLNDERIELLESLGFEWVTQAEKWTDRQAATYGCELLDATEQAWNAAFVIRESIEAMRRIACDLEAEGNGPRDSCVEQDGDPKEVAAATKPWPETMRGQPESRSLPTAASKHQVKENRRGKSNRQEEMEELKRLRKENDCREAGWKHRAGDLLHAALALEAAANALDLIHDVMKRSNVDLFRRAGLSTANMTAMRRNLAKDRSDLMFHSGGKATHTSTPSVASAASRVKARSLHFQRIEGFLTARSDQLEALKEKAMKQTGQKQKYRAKQQQERGEGEQVTQSPQDEEPRTVSFPAPRNGNEYTPIEVATVLSNNNKKDRWAIFDEMRARKLVPVLKSTAYKILKQYQDGKPLGPLFGMSGGKTPADVKDAEAQKAKALEWLNDAATCSLEPASVEDMMSVDRNAETDGSKKKAKAQSKPRADIIVATVAPVPRSTARTSDVKSCSANVEEVPPPTPDELGLPPPRRGKYYTPREAMELFSGVRKNSTLRANIRKSILFYGLVPVTRGGLMRQMKRHADGLEVPENWGVGGRASVLSVDDIRGLSREVGGAEQVKKEDIIRAFQAKSGETPSDTTIRHYMAVVKTLLFAKSS